MFDQDFEGPLFKVLSKNDSGEAGGNQSGILIPKPLGQYFPVPLERGPDAAPRADIRAELVANGEVIGFETVGYVHQTRARKRRPEAWITGAPDLRRLSRKGDILLIERAVGDDPLYRLTLLSSGTALHGAARTRAGTQSWGLLKGGLPFTSAAEVADAETAINQRTAAPFVLFDPAAAYAAQSRRIARSRAFRSAVIKAYGNRCAACGGGARLPSGRSELEAAHIVPRAQMGADDVRNGLALCRLHHWAFDNQVIGIAEDGNIRLSHDALTPPENEVFEGLAGRRVIVPENAAYAPHQDALAWHREFFEGGAAATVAPTSSKAPPA